MIQIDTRATEIDRPMARRPFGERSSNEASDRPAVTPMVRSTTVNRRTSRPLRPSPGSTRTNSVSCKSSTPSSPSTWIECNTWRISIGDYRANWRISSERGAATRLKRNRPTVRNCKAFATPSMQHCAIRHCKSCS